MAFSFRLKMLPKKRKISLLKEKRRDKRKINFRLPYQVTRKLDGKKLLKIKRTRYKEVGKHRRKYLHLHKQRTAKEKTKQLGKE